MIQALCPTCGTTVKCPDEMAGKSVPCTGCGMPVSVAGGAAGDLGSGGLGGYGGYGGYGAAQQPAQSSKSSGSPMFLKWYVLAPIFVVVIGLVVGVVMMISPKPQPVAAAPAPPDEKPPESKPAAGESSEKPAEKPAAPMSLTIEPVAEVSLDQGGTAKVTVKIQRGKLTGPIPLRVEGLPEQVTAEPIEIEEGKDSAELTLTAASEAPATKEAAKAKLFIEADESKAEREFAIVVKPPSPPVFAPLAAMTIKPGASATIELKIDRKGYTQPITLAVEGLPAKVTVTKAVVAEPAGTPATGTPPAINPGAAITLAGESGSGTEPEKELVLAENESSLKLTIAVASDAVEVANKVARFVATVREQKIETPLKLSIERYAFRIQPLPVITLKPGESKTIDVVVARRSYTGPLKIEPQGLPENVTANTIELAAGQTKAQLQIAAADNAPERVKSASLTTQANNATVKEALVVRVSKGEGSLLPAEVTADPEFARLLKKGSIGGRLEASSKQALMNIYGGTAESEAAVMKGLAWLAKHQMADGSWSFEKLGEGIEGCTCKGHVAEGAAAGGELKEHGVAATAFGILPFLGAGITHDQSPSQQPQLKAYRSNVLKGLEWMGTQMKKDKDFKKDGELPGGMYAHAIGTIALCEVYGLSKDDKAKIGAQKAIRYLLESQHEEGGWRYGPRQPGDVSVVGWVFLALRSGQLAGLPIDRDALIKAGKFLNTCAAGPDDAKLSRYSYLPGEPAKITTTAAGLLSRQYIGWDQDDPHLQAGVKYLMENLPPENASALGSIYYYYYATQVLHHMEGENWDKWNHRIREHLIRTQQQSGHEEGSWSPVGTDFGPRAGRIYATSMAIMTLECYYRHLPLYRKTVKVAEAGK